MTDSQKRRETRTSRSMAVNMADIARLANVSKPTVSRVLNDSPLVNKETRERVLEVARAHGYAVNRNAQKLRQLRTDTVAVLLDFGSHRGGRIGDPFIFELLAGVSEALSIRNQDLLLSPPGISEAKHCLDMLASRATDGFIFLGQGGREDMLNELARSDAPFVVWGAVDAANSYCAVGSDNRLGGTLVGRRFLQRGAKRWLFVGDISHSEIALRHQGMCEVAQTAPDVVVDLLPVPDMAFNAVHGAAAAWVRTHAAPDAVFAFSDTAAMAIISAFRDAGLHSPEHYALVGYNDIPPAAHFMPAITTIEQETHVAGAILVETLPTRIIVRDT
jgi:DNA-binding LacI/PurR family transcriptional regulator